MRTDTIPAVFSAPLAEAYYPVTFKSPSGATWTQKIEARRYFTSVVTALHVAEKNDDGKKPPSKRKHLGRMFNQSSRCNGKPEMKIDMLDADGEVVKTQALNNNYQKDLEVPAGSYDVRLYWRAKKDGPWTYEKTRAIKVTRDGWKITTGCDKAGGDIWFEP